MSRQVLCGLNHLHKLEVLHRDIKSMNILLTQDFSCKITDFGMSKLITSDMEIRHTCTAGTPLWMAPEVKTGVYGYPADIYSTGLVIYEIIEQKLPDYDRQNSQIVLPTTPFVSSNIVLPMVQTDPLLRKNIKDAKKLYDDIYIYPALERIRKFKPDLIKEDALISDKLLQDLEKSLTINFIPAGIVFGKDSLVKI